MRLAPLCARCGAVRSTRLRVRCLAYLLRALAIATIPALPLTAQPTGDRPNVVLLITDDLGYADIGSYGARDIRTPNLDRLAREGVRFTDFYANATTCTPTRAGLISGRYQQRYLVEQPLPAGTGVPGEMTERGLDASPFSLPRLLKTRDYATALMGKWHLGYAPSQSPLAHGFDTFFGLKSGYHDYWQHTDSRGEPDLWENDTRVRVSGYSTDLIARRAVEFIAAHAREPFFLDVAFNAPHWPFQDPDTASVAVGNARFLKPADSVTATRAQYVRMVERLDQRIGDILAALERHGLARHTLVIFTNDNGGEWLSDNTPLFNRKWTTWEGGIRVPALVRWPGRIPAGRVTSQVGITMDLTASILAAAGVVVPAEARLEGMDLLPVLTGQAPPAERTLFWRSTMRGGTQRAARRGDLKIVSDATHTFLFDVRRDPGERRDLARRQPHDVRALSLLLAAWEQSVDAEAARRR
jgi:arylsulfatase A-like enzyme